MNTGLQAKYLWPALILICLPTMAAEFESRKDHKQYDFHYDIRYPGRLRSDVGLDKVTEHNAKDLKAYNRRVVEWWPKRGMDFTPLEDIPGAPLRTWTPRIPKETMTGALLDNFPKEPFEAHLVNFRGVGDESLKDVKDAESYRCPAPVLRFADGRKRVILAKYLSEKDRKYLLKVYLADRARIDKTLLQDEYAVPVGAKQHAAGVEGLYKTGKVRFDTKHACIVVPSKAPLNGSSWVRQEDHEQVMATIAYLKNQMESYWAYHEYAGALVRYWERPKLYKYVPQFGHGGGGGGGGYGGCSLGGPGMAGVFHEWGHGMACGGILSLGGGETAADALQIMADPANIHKAAHQINRPWKNLFHGAYPGGGGYEIVADDPNWGYAVTAITSTLASDDDNTPMHVYAHLGVERGLWKKGEGIRGVGDMLGQVGARFAEFDCQQEFQFRQHFASANRSFLVAVDTEKGLYRCPPSEAPEPFGVSISRLVPEDGAKGITVDFQGDFDPETYSDWRVCIVGVGKDGRCRYTPLWNKGEMSMDIEDDDKRFWLTVTATPKALLGESNRGSAWVVYQGGFTYSYPYQVALKGCKPGSPYGTLADNNNTALAAPDAVEPALYGKDGFVFDLPPRMDKIGAEEFAKQLRENIEYGSAATVKAQQKLESFGPKPTGFQRWYYSRKISRTAASAYRAQLLLDDIAGAPHPNGGGWVSARSHVDPTAYVGPNCYVLGGAKVLNNAQLIDGAIVIGDGAVVKDHAKLSGKAAVIGLVEVSGFARVYWPEVNRPKPGTKAADTKEVQVTGIPDRGNNLSAGGIVANYDCLRPESVLLEDLLKKRGTGGFYLGSHTEQRQISYNGRLVGGPGFDAASGAGAYVFNGRDQYAELSHDVADLGEIMIVMRVKPESIGREQVLFDFGGNIDNRFTLAIGKDGKPVLSWSVVGKTEKVQSSSKLNADEWAELRVEINGQSAAIYVDNREAARAKTDFRAARAFPPQLGRRNFVMRSRDEKRPNYVKGRLDYVRIYSKVAENYKELPPVPLISPTKAMPQILAKLEEEFGDRPLLVGVYQGLAKESGHMDKARTWNDRLLLRQYTYELGSDPKTIAETMALRDKYYELEAQLAIKRYRLFKEYFDSAEARTIQKERDDIQKEFSVANKELKKAAADLKKQYGQTKNDAPKNTVNSPNTPEFKSYQKKLAEVKALIAQATEDETRCNKKLREMEAAVNEDTKEQRAALRQRIADLKKKVAQREMELSETSGPVAKVFRPVIGELQAKVDALTKKEGRTPAEEKELRDASSDIRTLAGHLKNVLTLQETRKLPPTGLLYRDLELVEMRAELQHLERLVKALLIDRFMADEQYIATKVALERARLRQRRKLPEPPKGQKSATQAPSYNEAYRELPAFKKLESLREKQRSAPRLDSGAEPYANKQLGDFPLKVEAAMNAWRLRCDENAEATNRDEFRVVGSTAYPRRFYSISDRVSPAMAERLAGESAPDDLKQLPAAITWQGKPWYTSTADWNTYHREEKDYENRNDRIKRWMKRVKPYRYAEK